MKRCVYIGFILLLLFPFRSQAEGSNVYGSDTTWVVNYQYSQVERDTFHFSLQMSELPDSLIGKGYQYFQVFWGTKTDGNEDCSSLTAINDLPLTLKHKYPTGKYFLSIRYYKNTPSNDTDLNSPDKQKCFWIFNQELQGSIVVRGKDGCIESGVDTFYVKIMDHQVNPPGTKYSVEVRKGSPEAPGDDVWKVWPDPALIKDSAMVIFTGATGIFGADIRFRMTYRESNTSPKSRTNVTEWRTVHVYQTPNLHEIFNFRDSLVEGERIEDFQRMEVCTNEELGAILYDSLVNVKYMYVDNLPQYRARYNFEVDYFRKDSIKQLKWDNVTTDTAMVDTANMIFRYPGFYKIRMVAFNECGLDSLHTDSIWKHDEKRHIVVFQGGLNVIHCEEDSICGMPEEGRIISLIDKGKRFEWDPVPEYTFLITKDKDGIPDKDTVMLNHLPEFIYYKDDHTFIPDGDAFACDSTLLKIRLYETGKYTINLTRTRYCDPPVTYSHALVIGDVPVLPVDTLWKHLGQTRGNAAYICGALEFKLPEVHVDSGYMSIDSIQWYFSKGLTRYDTLYQKYGTERTYLFDSIGNDKSYMTLRAHNFCGWSDSEKAELYTNMQPNVVLWRDSLEKNDSLCVGVNYEYHWIGGLPENYRIRGKWTKGVYVNGSLEGEGDLAILAASNDASIPKVGKVSFTSKADKVYETFTIENRANVACKQEYKDSLTVIAIPEAVIYDTIRYCVKEDVIQTEKLFENTPPDLKKVTWIWNQEPSIIGNQDTYQHAFSLSHSKFDTLYVQTFNSKGCYVKDSIVFKPQDSPELKFHEKNKIVCADTVLHPSDYATDYIQMTNVGNSTGVALKIYQDQIVSSALLFDTTQVAQVKKDLLLTHENQDTVRLIYETKNTRVTEGFGDCQRRDTLKIKVWRSYVRITGQDTIRNLATSTYSFAGPDSYVSIDTADIEGGQIKWNILCGEGSLDDPSKLKPVYTLAGQDKTLDSLVFELTGSTPCGKDLKDTLIVYLPKDELWAHADTICNTVDGYELWAPDKTYGKFIQESSIKWTLLDPTLGSIDPALGSGAKYKPAFNAYLVDTVKIIVEARNIYDHSGTGKVLKDTVFLKVNRAPVNIYPDTLYLKANTEEGRRIIFDDITVGRNGVLNKADAYCQNMSWNWTQAEGNGVSFIGASHVGIYIGTPADQKNYNTDMAVTLKAFEGCEDATVKVVLTGVMPPKVTLSNFDLCDGGSVRIDTGCHIQVKDKFVETLWSHNGNGSFSPDDQKYQAGVEDPIQKFTVNVIKNFTLYNGTPEKYEESANGLVFLYRKPDFTLFDGAGSEYTHDTLCLGESAFTYERNWVDGNFVWAHYGREHLTAIKSEGISGDFPDFVLNEGVNEAKFIVSVDMGQCKKWVNIADTIYLTRLKAMTGSFTMPAELCEGSTFTIADAVVDPLAKSYSWIATGGSVDQTNLIQPVYTAITPGVGTVSLAVVPPHGCPQEEVILRSFNIVEKPVLALKDTTICESSDLNLNFVLHSQIESIVWKANGRHFATTTIETTVEYIYHPQDIIDGQVQITAEVNPKMPCSEVNVFSMTVTYQKTPSFSGSLTGTVCQGDTLSLNMDIITVADCGEIVWNLEGTSAGSIENPNVVNTRYFSGEISGTQVLKITAEGLEGCVGKEEYVIVNIKRAEIPIVSVPNIRCEGSELTFSHQSSEKPAGAKGEWYINGIKEAETWYSFEKTFEHAGDYELYFVATYDGCPRSVKQNIKINPLPEVYFVSQPDSVVGTGKEIQFTPQTTGVIATYDWDFYGQGVMISEENGEHIHRFDLDPELAHLFSNVTLTVTDNNSCKASRTREIKVVNTPVAKFEITHFDHCTGNIAFKNISEGEDLDYSWDLGEGHVMTDTVPKDFVYTPYYQDSTYVISLKVSNQAGMTEFQQEVKMVSLLKPEFLISPDKEGCEKRQPEKGFSNRTLGDADLYTFSWGDGSPDGIYAEFIPFPVYHKYSNPEVDMKKFYITLTATNACYTKEYVDSISVHPNSISVEFIPDKTHVCFGNEIEFKNESFGFGADAQAWWIFEDSQEPVADNAYPVHHRFTKPGVYPVRLIMGDHCNRDTSDVVNIYVLGDISLDFEIEEGPYCSGQRIEMKVPVQLRDKFANFHWDFGDGYSENGVDSVMQKYLYPNSYSVKLTANSVSDGNCLITTQPKTIEVHKTPFAAISPVGELADCAPYRVEKFTRVGTGDELIFWDFKNGITSTDPVVSDVLFSNPGTYPVLLRLTSPEGCVDTIVKNVIVKEVPLPSFDISDSLYCTLNGNIEIGLTNKTPQSELATYEWSYNDGLPFSRTEQPGMLSLAEKFGEIVVKLVATNIQTNCKKEYTRKIMSGEIVRLQVEIDTTICYGEELQLANTASGISDISWMMGDGIIETDHDFAYLYEEPGQYTVKVIGGNDAGCKDSLEKRISVYPLPQADFTYDEDLLVLDDLPEGVDFGKLPKIKNGGIRFTNLSSVVAYDFTSGQYTSLWSFGDRSEILATEHPSHRFQNNGQYEVKLLVKSDNGCVDSISNIISIDGVKGLFIPNAFAPGAGVEENPGVALFQPKGIGLLSYQIKVYDQESGICVWKSDKLDNGRPAEGWDGIFNGEPLPKKSYVWEVNAIFIDGSVWTGENGKTKGLVVLIR